MKTATAIWVAVPAIGVVVAAALLGSPQVNSAPDDPYAYLVHFVLTTGVALLAFLSAFLVGSVAADIHDTRVVLLFFALVSIGGFFAEHGLATPDVLVPIDGEIEEHGLGLYQVAGVVSLFAGALFFSLSTRTWGAQARRFLGDRAVMWIGIVTISFIAFDALGLTFHTWFDVLPIGQAPSIWIIAAPTALLFGYAAVQYARSYQLARLPMQWALVMGLGLLATAAIVQAASSPWTWSWWEYHVLMLLGFVSILSGIVFEFSRRRSLRTIMEGLIRVRSLVQSELEYSDTISTLAAATEARDPETHGHTARVAEIAVRIGNAMKLPAERVRVLARAGLLHDIGKLGIPDSILLKNGSLTEAEWEVMRRHPELGHEIVRRAGSLEAESRLIRMHHERLDGHGYAAGLAPTEIPTDARILSVADVYDSLATDRPYRKAFPPERAMEILREEANGHLDPEIVEIWSRIYREYHE